MASPIGKFITWGLVSALAYHLVAGTKHLMMDLGIGETLEGGQRGAKLVILFSTALILLAGYLII
jgi:succinate dehydrogenase / fumarate reductase cytochrome b subunit